ncbi:MAG TPA: asparagine synthase (glutamine-hydrolyzing) [Vicinamibacterales bacterium]|nr:asparagine synthase (glutamine-hydrolyzing) [Vicinamibacterales bacterium]
MCGISGVFALDGRLHPDARAAVPLMNGALAHRGPDGEGFFDAVDVSLGHRRLAIIDRAGGHQPMANEDGTCQIVFNGEVYNHRDLRPELEAKGHRFRTSSDTEAILHAYEEYGPACVEKLEGMFAFVIYDGRRRELFAARDRLGKKPFFYTVLDGTFHFASELGALTRSPLWKGDLDLTSLEGYLSLGYFVAPATIYRDVHKLLPGHWLRVANGRIQTAEYWDVREFDTDQRPADELLPEIDAALRRAVHERLESEVPLGAFLSGGIDSGLVVSYMAEALGDRLITTSVGFGERGHNELEAAELTANHFGSRHHAEVIEPRLDDVLGPVTTGLSEPLADASAIPTWYVSRAARRHVTVALSGDGGDESFAGYDFRYVPHALEASARRFMPPGIAPAAGWLGAHWPRSRRLPRPLRVSTLLENLSRDPAGAYYSDLAFLKPADARALLGLPADRDPASSPVYAAVTDPYRRCPSDDAVQRSEYADLKVYLPNDPLVKVDRMSMAHSLEVRCPLLDRRVVELAFRIPASRKQTGRQGKTLLRRLAQTRLPAGLWRLPKRGFDAPMGSWLSGPYAARFREEVLGSNSSVGDYVDRQDLARRFDIHRRQEADCSYVLWATWVLDRWLRTVSRTESRPVASS